MILLVLASAGGWARAEEWQKVAFIGNAEVKSITGLVEVITSGEERIVHPGEKAKIGQVLRIWRGAEVILRMDRSESLVRAKGPVLLRLAPVSEGYERASVIGEAKDRFVVRAVRGNGKYQDGEYWREIRPGMSLPEGVRVRPYRASVLDFYHPGTRTAIRVTDYKKQTLLTPPVIGSSPTILAAKAP